MSFDWRQFLGVAEHLNSLNLTPHVPFQEEAAARCAVSRAYYAAFCHVRMHAKKQLQFKETYGPNSDSVHVQLVRHLRAIGQEKLGEIADDLHRLRDQRNKCDYDEIIASSGLKWKLTLMASAAIKDAQDIFQKLP